MFDKNPSSVDGFDDDLHWYHHHYHQKSNWFLSQLLKITTNKTLQNEKYKSSWGDIYRFFQLSYFSDHFIWNVVHSWKVWWSKCSFSKKTFALGSDLDQLLLWRCKTQQFFCLKLSIFKFNQNMHQLGY